MSKKTNAEKIELDQKARKIAEDVLAAWNSGDPFPHIPILKALESSAPRAGDKAVDQAPRVDGEEAPLGLKRAAEYYMETMEEAKIALEEDGDAYLFEGCRGDEDCDHCVYEEAKRELKQALSALSAPAKGGGEEAIKQTMWAVKVFDGRVENIFVSEDEAENETRSYLPEAEARVVKAEVTIRELA